MEMRMMCRVGNKFFVRGQGGKSMQRSSESPSAVRARAHSPPLQWPLTH
jgi:hypothetical protein